MNTSKVNEQEISAALFLLKEYLERDKRLEGRGISLEKIHESILDVRRQFDIVVREQINQGVRIEKQTIKLRELRALVKEVSGRDDIPEDTGSFRVDEVKRAIELAELRKKVEDSEKALAEKDKEERDGATWWQRQRVLWIVGFVIAFFTALLSGCVSYGVWYATRGKVGSYGCEKALTTS